MGKHLKSGKTEEEEEEEENVEGGDPPSRCTAAREDLLEGAIAHPPPYWYPPVKKENRPEETDSTRRHPPPPTAVAAKDQLPPRVARPLSLCRLARLGVKQDDDLYAAGGRPTQQHFPEGAWPPSFADGAISIFAPAPGRCAEIGSASSCFCETIL